MLSSKLLSQQSNGVLRATGNSVDTIDVVDKKYRSSIALYVSYNCIRNLSNIQQFKNLEKLYIEFNQIQSIADIEPLSMLENLKEIRINGNPICNLPMYDIHICDLCKSIDLIDGKNLLKIYKNKRTVDELFEWIEIEKSILVAKYVVYCASQFKNNKRKFRPLKYEDREEYFQSVRLTGNHNFPLKYLQNLKSETISELKKFLGISNSSLSQKNDFISAANKILRSVGLSRISSLDFTYSMMRKLDKSRNYTDYDNYGYDRGVSSSDEYYSDDYYRHRRRHDHDDVYDYEDRRRHRRSRGKRYMSTSTDYKSSSISTDKRDRKGNTRNASSGTKVKSNKRGEISSGNILTNENRSASRSGSVVFVQKKNASDLDNTGPSKRSESRSFRRYSTDDKRKSSRRKMIHRYSDSDDETVSRRRHKDRRRHDYDNDSDYDEYDNKIRSRRGRRHDEYDYSPKRKSYHERRENDLSDDGDTIRGRGSKARRHHHGNSDEEYDYESESNDQLHKSKRDRSAELYEDDNQKKRLSNAKNKKLRDSLVEDISRKKKDVKHPSYSSSNDKDRSLSESGSRSVTKKRNDSVSLDTDKKKNAKQKRKEKNLSSTSDVLNSKRDDSPDMSPDTSYSKKKTKTPVPGTPNKESSNGNKKQQSARNNSSNKRNNTSKKDDSNDKDATQPKNKSNKTPQNERINSQKTIQNKVQKEEPAANYVDMYMKKKTSSDTINSPERSISVENKAVKTTVKDNCPESEVAQKNKTKKKVKDQLEVGMCSNHVIENIIQDVSLSGEVGVHKIKEQVESGVQKKVVKSKRDENFNDIQNFSDRTIVKNSKYIDSQNSLDKANIKSSKRIDSQNSLDKSNMKSSKFNNSYNPLDRTNVKNSKYNDISSSFENVNAKSLRSSNVQNYRDKVITKDSKHIEIQNPTSEMKIKDSKMSEAKNQRGVIPSKNVKQSTVVCNVSQPDKYNTANMKTQNSYDTCYSSSHINSDDQSTNDNSHSLFDFECVDPRPEIAHNDSTDELASESEHQLSCENPNSNIVNSDSKQIYTHELSNHEELPKSEGSKKNNRNDGYSDASVQELLVKSTQEKHLDMSFMVVDSSNSNDSNSNSRCCKTMKLILRSEPQNHESLGSTESSQGPSFPNLCVNDEFNASESTQGTSRSQEEKSRPKPILKKNKNDINPPAERRVSVQATKRSNPMPIILPGMTKPPMASLEENSEIILQKTLSKIESMSEEEANQSISLLDSEDDNNYDRNKNVSKEFLDSDDCIRADRSNDESWIFNNETNMQTYTIISVSDTESMCDKIDFESGLDGANTETEVNADHTGLANIDSAHSSMTIDDSFAKLEEVINKEEMNKERPISGCAIEQTDEKMEFISKAGGKIEFVSQIEQNSFQLFPSDSKTVSNDTCKVNDDDLESIQEIPININESSNRSSNNYYDSETDDSLTGECERYNKNSNCVKAPIVHVPRKIIEDTTDLKTQAQSDNSLIDEIDNGIISLKTCNDDVMGSIEYDLSDDICEYDYTTSSYNTISESESRLCHSNMLSSENGGKGNGDQPEVTYDGGKLKEYGEIRSESTDTNKNSNRVLPFCEDNTIIKRYECEIIANKLHQQELHLETHNTGIYHPPIYEIKTEETLLYDKSCSDDYIGDKSDTDIDNFVALEKELMQNTDSNLSSSIDQIEQHLVRQDNLNGDSNTQKPVNDFHSDNKKIPEYPDQKVVDNSNIQASKLKEKTEAEQSNNGKELSALLNSKSAASVAHQEFMRSLRNKQKSVGDSSIVSASIRKDIMMKLGLTHLSLMSNCSDEFHLNQSYDNSTDTDDSSVNFSSVEKSVDRVLERYSNVVMRTRNERVMENDRSFKVTDSILDDDSGLTLPELSLLSSEIDKLSGRLGMKRKAFLDENPLGCNHVNNHIKKNQMQRSGFYRPKVDTLQPGAQINVTDTKNKSRRHVLVTISGNTVTAKRNHRCSILEQPKIDTAFSAWKKRLQDKMKASKRDEPVLIPPEQVIKSKVQLLKEIRAQKQLNQALREEHNQLLRESQIV